MKGPDDNANERIIKPSFHDLGFMKMKNLSGNDSLNLIWFNTKIVVYFHKMTLIVTCVRIYV